MWTIAVYNDGPKTTIRASIDFHGFLHWPNPPSGKENATWGINASANDEVFVARGSSATIYLLSMEYSVEGFRTWVWFHKDGVFSSAVSSVWSTENIRDRNAPSGSIRIGIRREDEEGKTYLIDLDFRELHVSTRSDPAQLHSI